MALQVDETKFSPIQVRSLQADMIWNMAGAINLSKWMDPFNSIPNPGGGGALLLRWPMHPSGFSHCHRPGGLSGPKHNALAGKSAQVISRTYFQGSLPSPAAIPSAGTETKGLSSWRKGWGSPPRQPAVSLWYYAERKFQISQGKGIIMIIFKVLALPVQVCACSEKQTQVISG